MAALPDTAAPPAPQALDWPTPAHLRVDFREGGPERGMVTLRDASRIAGVVREFDRATGRLRLLLDNGVERRVEPADFRSLFLSRPIELHSLAVSVPPGALQGRPKARKQKCTIAFTDSTTLETDVVALVREKSGLYLFVPDYGEQVLRWFVPAAVVSLHHGPHHRGPARHRPGGPGRRPPQAPGRDPGRDGSGGTRDRAPRAGGPARRSRRGPRPLPLRARGDRGAQPRARRQAPRDAPLSHPDAPGGGHRQPARVGDAAAGAPPSTPAT